MRWMIMIGLLGSVAWAQPARFEVKHISGVTLAVPVGWNVQQSATPVPTINLEERPGAADSPSVLLMMVPAQPGAEQIAAQLVRAAMPGGAQQKSQQRSLDGAVLTEYAGSITNIPARMAVLSRTTPQGGMVAVFAAPTARYTALGGPALLMTVLSGQAAGAPKAGAAPAPAALRIPPAYARRTQPVLDWFADNFESIPPAQIAAGLRRVNPTEAQLLGVYGAFANLVHYRGCLADASLRLPNGATCAQTAAGWRQTLQLLNGNVAQAIQEANRQRGALRIAARCSDGRTDAASCAAFRQTMSTMSNMQHESMMRVIHNLGGNGCIVGDPGCVPY